MPPSAGWTDWQQQITQAADQQDDARYLDLLHTAITHWPEQAEPYARLAAYYRYSQQAEQERKALQQARQAGVLLPEDHARLGQLYFAAEEWDQASTVLQQAIQQHGEHAAWCHDLACALLQQRQWPAASHWFERTQALDPGLHTVDLNLGLLHEQQQHWQEAVAYLQRFVQQQPEHSPAHYHLAHCCYQCGDVVQAIAEQRIALQAWPDNLAMLNDLASWCAAAGQTELARSTFEQALQHHPDQAALHGNYANLLQQTGAIEAALQHYHKALALDPDHPAAHNNLANVLRGSGRLHEAINHYHKALAINPDYAEAYSNLGNAWRELGDFDQAEQAYHKALALKPNFIEARSNALFAMNYNPRHSNEAIAAAHRQWGDFYPAAKPCPRPAPVAFSSRWRIGFVSADFCCHSVAFFFETLLDHLDAEVFLYAQVRAEDAVTKRLRQKAHHWCDITALSDEQAASRIRADQLHALVDLSGHTAGNRLGVFMHRPAALQISWLGYPNTTGLPVMDLRISDAWADPAGSADTLHSETLARFAGGFLAYSPPVDAPAVNELPLLRNGILTLGSFNHHAKMNDGVYQLWGQLLQQLPQVRLCLKSRSLGDATVRQQVSKRLQAAGARAEQVLCLPPSKDQNAHLACYHDIDLALDPFPYNGTTTSCEALWMGVPLLTLAGTRHASRVGVSILQQLGHAEWIVQHSTELSEKIKHMLADPASLNQQRQRLRHQMRASRLCDGQRLADDFSAMLSSHHTAL